MDAKNRIRLARIAEKARKHPEFAREMGIKVSLKKRLDVSGNNVNKDGHFELQR